MTEHLESDAQRAIRLFNFELLFVTFLLFVYGLLVLYSATNGPGIQYLCKAQIYRAMVAIVLGIGLFFLDMEVLKKMAYPLYIFCILLLILVDILGHVGGGSQRWIRFGFIGIQPSEMTKVALIMVYAKYFSGTRLVPPYTLRQLLIPFLILLPSFLLILIQPDLGTSGILSLCAGSILLFMGIRVRSILLVLLIGFAVVPLAYQYGLKDYQKKRVLTFLDPTTDPRGSGYNALQTKIAVGSGKIFGKGYLKGTQAQLNFIPEQHTDFIFSVLAEEFGFVGSVILIALMGLYCAFALRTVVRARDKFQMIMGLGLTALFFWHAFINLGMVSGVLPIVGVTLPFISYGGSSLVTFGMTTALLLNISRKKYIF